MRGTESRHPPGMVIMLTGELARYADTMADLEVLDVPLGSGLYWFRGVLIADGLNKGLQALCESPTLEWAFLMGDDHRFDPSTLIRMLDREVDVVIPTCVHRAPPFYSNVAGHGGQETRLKLLGEFPTSGLYELGDKEVCGDAGMLIRKRVLSAVDFPWYDNRRSGSFSSDDFAFTNRIRKAGFKVYVDCDVRIGHTTPMTVTPVVMGGEWKINVTAGDKHVGLLGVKSP